MRPPKHLTAEQRRFIERHKRRNPNLHWWRRLQQVYLVVLLLVLLFALATNDWTGVTIVAFGLLLVLIGHHLTWRWLWEDILEEARIYGKEDLFIEYER